MFIKGYQFRRQNYNRHHLIAILLGILMLMASKLIGVASFCNRHIRTTKRGSIKTLLSLGDDSSQDITEINHFYCYLLHSLAPASLKTYIGFTTHPQRRIRQHNGELANGARRTKSGRPWEYVAIVDGFQSKISAMKFEWAWQNVHKSLVFRQAVGCDKLARKMKRRRGIKPRLDELGILMNDCSPFNTLPLKVYFLEKEYQDLFHDVSTTRETSYVDLVDSLDDMPFARSNTRETTSSTVLSSSSFGVKTMVLSGSSFGMKRNNWMSVGFGSMFTYNPLIRLNQRQKTTWALNAVNEINVEESSSEQIKVPAKFKSYPFSVSRLDSSLLSHALHTNKLHLYCLHCLVPSRAHCGDRVINKSWLWDSTS